MKALSVFLLFLILPFQLIASPIGSSGLMAAYEFSGNANDSSGNGNHGIVNGATLTNDRFGNNAAAYYFDGSSHISVAHDSSLNFTGNTVSVSLWVELDQFSLQTIFAKRSGTYTDYGVFVQTDGSHGFSGEDGPFNDWGEQAGTSGLSLSSWHHIVGVKSTSDVQFFVDGALVRTEALGAAGQNQTSGDLVIGALTGEPGGLTAFTQGKIDDIYIFDRVLSASEVDTLYSVPTPLGNAIFLFGAGLVLLNRRRAVRCIT